MYKIISPLGGRFGSGTFDTFYNVEKYNSWAEAITANDFVVINFVEDEKGIKYFEAYHIAYPNNKKYLRLEIQHFPCGIDKMDDDAACILAETLYKN